MKFRTGYELGKPVFTVVYWSDHYLACEKCRKVDLEKSSTFFLACVTGAQLLNEELVKRQAPIVAKKNEEVRKWAEYAGVFKMKK